MRKRYIISFMIFIFAFGSASAKCGWHIHVEVYNNGISVNHIYMINLGTTAYYVEIAPGDSLKVGAGGNSNCWPNWFVLIHDSDTIYNANLTNSYYATFVDTGHYYCQYQNFDMLPDWYAILD